MLVEGDDANEPISDTVRGIIDGHIMLSRKIAMRNHYPAIDVLASVSRLMSTIAQPDHKEAANKIRNLMSIGAYKSGTNPELDYAIGKMNEINEFLQQRTDEKISFDETMELIQKTVAR